MTIEQERLRPSGKDIDILFLDSAKDTQEITSRKNPVFFAQHL
jgi:hypothetical protein